MHTDGGEAPDRCLQLVPGAVQETRETTARGLSGTSAGLSRQLGSNRPDAGNERPEAGGRITFVCQVLRHSSRTGYLLKLWHEPPQGAGWIPYRVRVAKSSLSPDVPKRLIVKGSGERVGFAQIPRFEFLTDDADEHVPPTLAT